FQAEDGIRDFHVTGVQTCALPICPPSVLIGQLRDHLAAGWQLDGGGDLLAALTTEHPLQPFSRRYFEGCRDLFSYAGEWRLLHRAEAGEEQADVPLEELLPDAPLDASLLQRFLRNPVEQFFAWRLKAFLREEEVSIED